MSGRQTSARRAHVWIKLIPATHSEPNYECRQRNCHAPLRLLRTTPHCPAPLSVTLLQLGKLFCFLVARMARTSQAVCQQFVAGVADTMGRGEGEAARGRGGRRVNTD